MNRCPDQSSRPFLIIVLVIANATHSLAPLSAQYMMPDLVNIPVDRLVKNLEKQVKANAKDHRALFALARVHGMAYALKSDKCKVWRGRENLGAWFGHQPRHVPFRNQPATDPKKLEAAKAHLAKAIQRFDECLKLQPKNLTAQLGRAWCIEQTGDKEKAIAAYRKVIENAWKKEGASSLGGLGSFVTIETAGYLTPLLDAKKDRAEIAELNKRKKRLASLPRPITPIVVPLREGLSVKELMAPDARVEFDLDGTGKKTWNWISPEAGWLVFDRRGNGRITSGLQMFGTVSFWLYWENGYQALKALDDDQDGNLSGSELTGLAIWRDANSNAVSDEGEVRSLSHYGIASLGFDAEVRSGNSEIVAHCPRGVTFADGTVLPTYDFILRSYTVDSDPED